jgi:hypothetical protein
MWMLESNEIRESRRNKIWIHILCVYYSVEFFFSRLISQVNNGDRTVGQVRLYDH